MTAARPEKVRSGVAETSWPRWAVAGTGEEARATAAAGAAIAAAAMVIASPAVSERAGRRRGDEGVVPRVVSMVSTLGIPGPGQNPAGHRIGPGVTPRRRRGASPPSR